MKKVGLFLREYESISNNSLLALRKDLFDYLNNYNILVVCIPLSYEMNENEAFSRVEELLKECSGVILPGGSDCFNLDLKIVRYLYEQNIPTLGLCLGMQMMSLAFHGDLKRLNTTIHQSREEYVHEVKIKEGSRLMEILKEPTIMVNSRHIDYITKTNLKVAAVSSDLIIEAVEDKSKKFFIGVQWHPESLSKNIYSKRLFDAFIDALQ